VSLVSLLYMLKVTMIIFFVVSLYMDDLLVIGSNIELIQQFKEDMMRVFEITDLGEMSYFLGIEIEQRQNEIFICQQKHAEEILKKFRMGNCKSMRTPMCQKEKLCKDDGTTKVDEFEYRSLVGCYKTRYYVCCKCSFKIYELC